MKNFGIAPLLVLVLLIGIPIALMGLGLTVKLWSVLASIKENIFLMFIFGLSILIIFLMVRKRRRF